MSLHADPLHNNPLMANSQFQSQLQDQTQEPSKDFSQSQSPSRQLVIPFPEFQEQYQLSIALLNPHTQSVHFLEKQVENTYLDLQQQQNSELVTMFLLEAMAKRQNNVENAILNDQLQIVQNKPKKSFSKAEEAQNSDIVTPQQQKAYLEQLQKRHQQIVRQHKKQQRRLQKLKQQEESKKLQLQNSRIAQQQKQKEQMRKHHSQIISQKVQQQKEKRQKQQKQHEERNKDYQFIVKSWANSVLLHEKMEKQFRKRYEAMFEEERNKIQTQKTRLSLNAKIQDLNINQHEAQYLAKRSEREAVRAAKLQEQQRTVQAREKQLQKYKKYKRPNEQGDSDEELNEPEDEENSNGNKFSSTKRDKTYHELQEQKRNKALEKRKKMEDYWQTFVKEQKQPKVDPKKQQQLQTLIQSLENARKMRKIKNEKGEYVYEELKLSDPTLKGMEYLEHARELGRMRKSLKRKDTMDDKSSVHQQNERKKRSIDYLKQLRESRSSSMNSSGMRNNKLSFLDKKDISFHEKLERVDRETFKLEQLTRNSENQLKYGKFKTSEEILQYKEDIDNNHLQILRMKIKLAGNGKH